jgi:hypothetical protein
VTVLSLKNDDETLPTMYERTKAPKKGENQEQNGRTHAQEGK